MEKLKKRERIEPGRKRGKKPQEGWAWEMRQGERERQTDRQRERE